MAEQVKITLMDGKERLLLFNHRAQKELQDKFGIDVLNKRGFDKVDASRLPEILEIGLRYGDPNITLDYVLDNANAGDNEVYLFSIMATLEGKSVQEIQERAKQNLEKLKQEQLEEKNAKTIQQTLVN